MHFALDGLPEYTGRYEVLNEPGMQFSVGYFGSPEDMQRDFENCRRGVVPVDPSLSLQIPTVDDPDLAPEGKHAASVYAMYFPVERERSTHGALKTEMGERVIDKICKLAPNFRDLISKHTTFASYHMESMFAAPHGDFCHGLIHPELMGANRPGPRGWRDLPVPVDGLFLGGAGCAGGPGITFIPGYNAGYEALESCQA
jgi:phytoene dehydrogenase-like protein